MPRIARSNLYRHAGLVYDHLVANNVNTFALQHIPYLILVGYMPVAIGSLHRIHENNKNRVPLNHAILPIMDKFIRRSGEHVVNDMLPMTHTQGALAVILDICSSALYFCPVGN